MDAAFGYCEAQVREGDKDRYLSTLFAPADRRRGLFALYAFNQEIARVRELVREPLPGEVRLQWWRDVLAGAARGEVYASPVAAALLDTIARHALDPDKLLQLIDARSSELYDDPMLSISELERFARETAALLIELAAQVLGIVDRTVRNAAEEGGLAIAMTGLLRTFALQASHGRTHLPLDLLQRHGATTADIFAGRTTPALLAAMAEVRTAARNHLGHLRATLPNVPVSALPAFLPAALVHGYLAIMQRSDYDPFRTVVDVPQWRKQWILWRASRRPARIAG